MEHVCVALMDVAESVIYVLFWPNLNGFLIEMQIEWWQQKSKISFADDLYINLFWNVLNDHKSEGTSTYIVLDIFKYILEIF